MNRVTGRPNRATLFFYLGIVFYDISLFEGFEVFGWAETGHEH